jgi:orotate phosphoribosyltransferase
MGNIDVLDIYRKNGAFLEGHFLLSSGLHSNAYLQSELVMQYPFIAKKLVAALADKIYSFDFSTVLSPAVGGIRPGYELARIMSKKAIFAERLEGKLFLRRGFHIEKGERVIIMEDVITTGKSTNETIEVAKNCGANVVLVASLIDRSGSGIDFDVPFFTLASINVATFTSDNCQLCKDNIPFTSPGSRHI